MTIKTWPPPGYGNRWSIRLSKAFGSTPETWVHLQAAFDLAQAFKHESKIKVARFKLKRVRRRHAAEPATR